MRKWRSATTRARVLRRLKRHLQRMTVEELETLVGALDIVDLAEPDLRIVGTNEDASDERTHGK